MCPEEMVELSRLVELSVVELTDTDRSFQLWYGNTYMFILGVVGEFCSSEMDESS